MTWQYPHIYLGDYTVIPPSGSYYEVSPYISLTTGTSWIYGKQSPWISCRYCLTRNPRDSVNLFYCVACGAPLPAEEY